MTKIYRRVIKLGTNRAGITLPRDWRMLKEVEVGDWLECEFKIIRKKGSMANDVERIVDPESFMTEDELNEKLNDRLNQNLKDMMDRGKELIEEDKKKKFGVQIE